MRAGSPSASSPTGTRIRTSTSSWPEPANGCRGSAWQPRATASTTAQGVIRMVMTDVKVGRLGTAAAWISAVCCLPYLILKVVWTVGVPVGITDRSLLHSNGWVAGNAVMAVLQLAGLLLVLA